MTTVPTSRKTPCRLAREPVALRIVAVACTASEESFEPFKSNVTVPKTPFTVPVKTSVSWNVALPSARMIRVPLIVEVPLNVPV